MHVQKINGINISSIKKLLESALKNIYGSNILYPKDVKNESTVMHCCHTHYFFHSIIPHNIS